MPSPLEFSVWAPVPQRVRLSVEGAVHDMTRDDDGWWRAAVEASPEADYGFLLDDDTPPPARRSPRRPPDAHGRLPRRDAPADAWCGRPAKIVRTGGW